LNGNSGRIPFDGMASLRTRRPPAVGLILAGRLLLNLTDNARLGDLPHLRSRQGAIEVEPWEHGECPGRIELVPTEIERPLFF
jgi:hypothetical protein